MKNANVKAIINANYSCKQFLEYLQDKYTFTDEELKNMTLIKDHLINLNVVFSKIKK